MEIIERLLSAKLITSKKTEKIKYLSLKAILVVALSITNFRSQCKAVQN